MYKCSPRTNLFTNNRNSMVVGMSSWKGRHKTRVSRTWLLQSQLFRQCSSGLTSTATPQARLKVWVSQSRDIYTNLALEDWLYTKQQFDREQLLLLWHNTPCVVIGRHQNPWAECDVSACLRDGISVVRRNSGGGAVYHDLGNMCMSFFTKRDDYNRKKNLQMIVDAITRVWPLDLTINNRDDIVLDNKHKISGTAAKLGGKTAYHHCTLLTNVNKKNLRNYLTTNMLGIESRATESVRSEVCNLNEADSSITYEALIDVISGEFLRSSPCKADIDYVDPSCTERFPQLMQTRDQLLSSQWIFHRTPKFSLRRTFTDLSNNKKRNLEVHLEIDKGRLKQINLDGVVVKDSDAMCEMIAKQLHNVLFNVDAINSSLQLGYNNVADINSAQVYLFIWKCFRQMFS